jgi:hypothetical protein
MVKDGGKSFCNTHTIFQHVQFVIYFGLVNILKAKDINKKYKVIIYKTNKTSSDVWGCSLGSE